MKETNGQIPFSGGSAEGHPIRHIFLTGEKQIGKSTLLKKVLAGYSGQAGGFFTVRTKAFLKDGYSVHLFGFDAVQLPDESNLLFVCGKADEHTKERFDRLGGEMLRSTSSLLVMDELGPKERDAVGFRSAVLQAIDRCPHVIGVLQAPCESYWPEITQNPAVEIIEITESNRNDDSLVGYIRSVIHR